MKTYYIYYLPNAVRDYSNGKIFYGKIGCTNDYHKRVVWEKSFTPKFGYLDITGHHVLETVYGTKADAEAIEAIWQDNFILIDGPRTNKHRKFTKEHRQNLSKSRVGKSKPTAICPYCGKEGGVPQMKRWHFDNCKQKA